MKKILIMGENQFVGEAIAKEFLEKGYKVYALNRGTRKNLDAVIHLKCDRNKVEDLEQVLKNIYVDAIIDVSGYTQSEVKIIQNIMKNRFLQYIFISSASIYNNISSYPVNEDDFVGENNIWGDYAKNKFLAESEIINNSKLFGFKYTIFRPFYIYGIGNNHNRENYIFSRIKYDLPIYLPNKGENIVQFGYIDDLVNAILLSIDNELYFDEIFNISGDECISFNKFVEICGKVMGKKVNIKFINTSDKIKARDWFPFRDIHLFGDISKIKKRGFKNQYSLFDGLKKVYDYNEKNKMITKPILNKLENI